MIQYNFPIYSSHDNGERLVKHITPSRCIMVFLDRIETFNYTNLLSDEMSKTTIYWDELRTKRAFEISKEMFDEFRKETINQLINY